MQNVSDVSGPRFLVFKLENLRYALKILNVEDIVELSPASDGPAIADRLASTCGTKVPIIDLRTAPATRAEKENPDVRERHFVIVVKTELHQKHCLLGLVADRVAEVVDLDTDDVRPSTVERVLPDAIRLDEKMAHMAMGCAV